MKVIVCGGSDPSVVDRYRVFAALNKAHSKRSLTQVVHGASGVGKIAEEWASMNGVLSGALLSGDVMATDPDGVIAFPGAPAALLANAREAGVKVWCPYGEVE